MYTMDPPKRALYGFIAGAAAVLIFHQGAWAALHLAGLMPPPYPMSPVPPFSVPLTVDFCFWGGVWGLLYGLALPKLRMPPWLSGLLLGVLAMLVLWFIVAPIKGRPMGGGWVPRAMLNTLIIHGVWGIGVGLIMQVMSARVPQRA